jgi:hypothetical protein
LAVSQAAFHPIAPPHSIDSLPLVFEEQSSRVSALLWLMALTPVTAAVVVPVGLVAASAADVPSLVQEHPAATVQITLGALLWAVLFLTPMLGIIRRFGSRRRLEIADGMVMLRETSLFRSRTTRKALNEFDGVCHAVRTSLSGVRHQLLLVDRASRRHIAFHAADRIGRETIERAVALLGLPEIAAKDLLTLGGRPMRLA